MREADVQRAVMDYLGICGFAVFRRNVGAMRLEDHGKARFVRFSTAGAADLWAIQRHTGTHWEIEVKVPGKKPSAVQLAWGEMIQRNGGKWLWCDGIAMCRAKLDALEKDA